MTEPRELHDAPMAAELVEAVREFLERDVMSATEGRVQFHTRVSLNVLATVERELRLGPALEAAHEQRLHDLGFTSDVDLAAAIRDGQTRDRTPEITAAVLASVHDKLRVANPTYTT